MNWILSETLKGKFTSELDLSENPKGKFISELDFTIPYLYLWIFVVVY